MNDFYFLHAYGALYAFDQSVNDGPTRDGDKSPYSNMWNSAKMIHVVIWVSETKITRVGAVEEALGTCSLPAAVHRRRHGFAGRADPFQSSLDIISLFNFPMGLGQERYKKYCSHSWKRRK